MIGCNLSLDRKESYWSLMRKAPPPPPPPLPLLSLHPPPPPSPPTHLPFLHLQCSKSQLVPLLPLITCCGLLTLV